MAPDNAARVQPDAEDPGHVRMTVRAMDGIAATLEQQERLIAEQQRTITALRISNAALEQAATAVADENAKLAAALKNQETPK